MQQHEASDGPRPGAGGHEVDEDLRDADGRMERLRDFRIRENLDGVKRHHEAGHREVRLQQEEQELEQK